VGKQNFTKSKVLFVTFEYLENTGGGIGACFNGLVQHLDENTPFDVLLFDWHDTNAYFRWIQYVDGSEKVVHEEHYLDFFDDENHLAQYSHIHILHAGEEPMNIAERVKANGSPQTLIYSCHSLFKYEQHIRKIPEERVSFEGRMLKQVDVIHVLNRTSAGWLEESYPDLYQEKTIITIPNGVDIRDVADEEETSEQADTDTVTIVCMSRWAAGKGIETLIDAAPKIQANRPEVRIIIGGRGGFNEWDEPTNIYIRFLDQKLEETEATNITALGWLEKSEVETYLKDATLCVLPSEIEYFPYAFLEPCLQLTPVLCTRLDTIKETFTEGSHFIGFDVGDSDTLAEKLLQALNEPEKSQAMVARAREHICSKYSWASVAQAYTALLYK